MVIAANSLKSHTNSILGVTANIEIAAVNGVERSIGKAQRIRDYRPEKS